MALSFAENESCRKFGSQNPDQFIRFFNIFGQRQDPNGTYAAVIPKWFAGLIKGETIYINGVGETSRDFCYIDIIKNQIDHLNGTQEQRNMRDAGYYFAPLF